MSIVEYIISISPIVDSTMFDLSIMYSPPIISIIDIMSSSFHLSFLSFPFSATISLFRPFASMNPPITSLIASSIIPLQNITISPNTIVVIPSVSCIFDIDLNL